MLAAALPAIANLVGLAIDRAIPDKNEAERIKAPIIEKILNFTTEELKSATAIIVSEANGASWLQRNWRPLVMLWFAGLVGAHWLGFTPPNLPEAQVLALLGIVKVGLGGYVVGRSVEKAVAAYKQ